MSVVAASQTLHRARALPMQAPDLAVRELERCMAIGLAGVEIGTHINDWNLDDECLEPFWAAAEELGAAVFVHPWDMMGQGRMPRHWLPWLVSMPAETSLAICSLAMGGVWTLLITHLFCARRQQLRRRSGVLTTASTSAPTSARPALRPHRASCSAQSTSTPWSAVQARSSSWSASWAPTGLRSGPTTLPARRVSAWTADRELTSPQPTKSGCCGYGARVLGRHGEDCKTAASLAYSEWLERTMRLSVEWKGPDTRRSSALRSISACRLTLLANSRPFRLTGGAPSGDRSRRFRR